MGGGRAQESLRGVISRRLGCGVLAVFLALVNGCSTASSTSEAPAPVLWTFEDLSWYKVLNKVSMNSTVGPIIVGKTVLYGGTYGYTLASQETRTSKLALIDAASGQARWRLEYNGTWGPIVLQGDDRRGHRRQRGRVRSRVRHEAVGDADQGPHPHRGW